MSAPNLTSISTITAKSAIIELTTLGATVLQNAASSNKVFKVSSLIISNIDGSSAADFTLRVAKAGGAAFNMFHTVSVPADSVLVALDKNTTFYLEENDSFTGIASADSDLLAFIAYEEIS